MGWIGKIIGGTVGFVLGGPLGMIAGAVFGNVFDKAPLQGESRTGSERAGQGRFGYWSGQQAAQSQEQAQMVFFVGAFSMLAKLASVDGGVSAAERSKVEEFITRDLRLDPQSSAVALQIFETASRSGGSFEQFAVQFYDSFQMNRQMLELMIDIFYRVSFADGRITAKEEALINRAGEIFRFTRDQMDAVRRRYGSSSASGGGLSRAYAVLGLKPDAENEEIKRAYRKLVSEYHPDKIASKGLPEEFTTFAADKFREIQSAYDELKSARNL